MPQTDALGKKIKELRQSRNLSARQLADMMYVSQPTITRWETGERMPDISMLTRLAKCLGTDVTELIDAMDPSAEEPPVVILVDDESIILKGSLRTLERALPDTQIYAFQSPAEAIDFARSNRVSVAFLDIEMGPVSGFDLCRELLEINPRTNVIYLTAYMEHSFTAWSTGASGFAVKPLSENEVASQLSRLRYPVKFGGNNEK